MHAACTSGAPIYAYVSGGSSSLCCMFARRICSPTKIVVFATSRTIHKKNSQKLLLTASRSCCTFKRPSVVDNCQESHNSRNLVNQVVQRLFQRCPDIVAAGLVTPTTVPVGTVVAVGVRMVADTAAVVVDMVAVVVRTGVAPAEDTVFNCTRVCVLLSGVNR